MFKTLQIGIKIAIQIAIQIAIHFAIQIAIRTAIPIAKQIAIQNAIQIEIQIAIQIKIISHFKLKYEGKLYKTLFLFSLDRQMPVAYLFLLSKVKILRNAVQLMLRHEALLLLTGTQLNLRLNTICINPKNYGYC
jgi:hypothetical protein